MAQHEYERRVSVSAWVSIKIRSNDELSEEDVNIFAEDAAGDIISVNALEARHPGGIDDAGCDSMSMNYMGTIELVDIRGGINSVEVF